MAKTPKRYTERERARILADMEKHGLTQVAAAKKHGIGEVTLWKWLKASQPARAHRTARDLANGSLAAMVRAEVQARVRVLVPEIVREEVVRAFGTKLL